MQFQWQIEQQLQLQKDQYWKFENIFEKCGIIQKEKNKSLLRNSKGLLEDNSSCWSDIWCVTNVAEIDSSPYANLVILSSQMGNSSS